MADQGGRAPPRPFITHNMQQISGLGFSSKIIIENKNKKKATNKTRYLTLVINLNTNFLIGTVVRYDEIQDDDDDDA